MLLRSCHDVETTTTLVWHAHCPHGLPRRPANPANPTNPSTNLSCHIAVKL